MILGRDILQDLGIVLDFQERQIRWKEYYTPMKNPEILRVSNYSAENTQTIQAETERNKLHI